MTFAPFRIAGSRLFSLVFACAMFWSVGCGGGGTSFAPSGPAQKALAEWVECTSTVPVDSGNPNKPVIVLKGARVIDQPLGTPYIDQGATAADPQDGDITGQIQITGATGVNTNTAGDYLVRYNVTDSAHLAAVEVVRVVRVNAGDFAPQTPRDIGTTGAHLGYYEHLPVHYSDDPNETFPLIVYIHGWSHARFLDPYRVQAPLSTLEGGNLVTLIKHGHWDNTRPFIVLSPQKCEDRLEFGVTAARMKRFVDYAVNTYKVDPSRIYLGGHSQGSGDTWDYVLNYPQQMAAIFPMSGGYGASVGCALKQTPAWAFVGQNDAAVAADLVGTVRSINACNPAEQAKLTVFAGVGHNDINDPVLDLTGLGQGMPEYDIYDQSIYEWLLEHSRK